MTVKLKREKQIPIRETQFGEVFLFYCRENLFSVKRDIRGISDEMSA